MHSFELHDSSISSVGIEHAASSSLLSSAAVIAHTLLNQVKKKAGLSASTFTFQGSNNLFTNPLTYPQYENKEQWLELLTQKGYNPTMIIYEHRNDHIFREILPKYRMNQSANELIVHTSKYFEKIGSTDVSLNEYDAISDLRDKFNFATGVSSFLLKKPILIPFLERAYDELVTCFPLSEFGLEVKVDYEIDNWSSLFLSITSSGDSDSIGLEIEKFIGDWMFKQSPEVRKLVTIVDRIL